MRGVLVLWSTQFLYFPALTLLAIEKANNEPFVARSIIVDGTELKTNAKGMLTVEKCIGDTVKVELKPTLTCCTSKALEIKVSSKETARLISVAKKSELDVKVKDVETCEIIPGVEVTTTLSSGVNLTKYSNYAGVPIKFPDCHEAKSKLFAKKDGYCSVIEEVKRVNLKTEKDLFIRKHQGKHSVLKLLKKSHFSYLFTFVSCLFTISAVCLKFQLFVYICLLFVYICQLFAYYIVS